MSEIKLKRCPFCGGEDIGVMTDDNGTSWYIFCKDCGCCCGYAMHEEEAVKAWNRRVNNE